MGTETGDDAGVYQVSADQALVTTADLITPPFDDPFAYGRIAAANAVSDVYAMGGRPVCALNLCVFPKALSGEVAREILAGAHAVLAEVGAALLGGHTVHGPELLFGQSVTGLVHPARIWRNVGGQAGDALILTKPLGAGLLVTGARRGLVQPEDRAACAAALGTSNQRAASVLSTVDVHAATDVTGFGLVGHLLGMLHDSPVGTPGLCAHVQLGRVPLYAGAGALAVAGITCGGSQANRAAYHQQVAARAGESASALPDELLYDPQTSGGLLVAVAAQDAAQVLARLGEAGVIAACIGQLQQRATPDDPMRIRLLG